MNLLKSKLSFINEEEQKKYLESFDKTINECIDSGMSEIDAVNDLGSIDKIVNNIKKNYTIEDRIDNLNKNNNKLIAISIVTFPIWFSLLILVLSILLSIAILSIVFITTGITLLFSTTTILDAPVAAILYNIGLSFLLLALGVVFIPLFKYATKYSKKGIVYLKNVVKEKI